MASGTIKRQAVATTTASIELTANSSVSPFSAYGTGSVTIPNGCIPIIALTYGVGSANPTAIRINSNGSITAYSKATGTVNVVVAFIPSNYVAPA